MDDRRKKGKREIQTFEHLENEKSFLVEIKSIFHHFLMATPFGEKKKNSRRNL